MIEAKRRAKEGKKKYANTEDCWDNWDNLVRFVENAKEEAADQYNYLEELRFRVVEAMDDLYAYKEAAEGWYNEYNKLKEKHAVRH